mgnify:CR=1 FL=1
MDAKVALKVFLCNIFKFQLWFLQNSAKPNLYAYGCPKYLNAKHPRQNINWAFGSTSHPQTVSLDMCTHVLPSWKGCASLI